VDFQRIDRAADFHGRKLRSGVRLAEAQQQETLLAYQQTIQGAFRGVSDALVGYRKDQEFRAQQELLAHSAQDAAQLSGQRYKSGTTSYLEVLTNETNYFTAELGLAQARLNELLSLVQSIRLSAAAAAVAGHRKKCSRWHWKSNQEPP